MVYRELTDRYPERLPSLEDIVLEVKQATRKGQFHDISFSVKAGEIVGVAGLMGAGRTEMMRSLFGLDPLDQGEIWVHGKKAVIKNQVMPSSSVSALSQRIAKMKDSCWMHPSEKTLDCQT